ncbi:peptidase S24/S26A/S26B/S26C [Amanita rubescens]|nr:peptidase S24/S26A/S26B/S26C [Amanita rubescens]
MVIRRPLEFIWRKTEEAVRTRHARFVAFWATPLSYKFKYYGVGSLKLVNYVCLFHLMYQNVGRISTMDGLSMLPNLAETGEVVVEDCLTYKFWPIQRGDLVTLKSPLDPSRIICKRVLGLPGDIVCVDPTGQLAPPTEHVIVPKGHIWIMGDNSTYSRDSREYGPVPISLVQARLGLQDMALAALRQVLKLL